MRIAEQYRKKMVDMNQQTSRQGSSRQNSEAAPSRTSSKEYMLMIKGDRNKNMRETHDSYLSSMQSEQDRKQGHVRLSSVYSDDKGTEKQI